MGYLIDTSVFIAWERGELDRERLIGTVGDARIALSAITASELLHGVERADSSQRRARRAAFVEAVLASVDVLIIDLETSRTPARIWADLRSRGTLVGAHDLWIAATAMQHGLALATRNLRGLERVEGLTVAAW